MTKIDVKSMSLKELETLKKRVDKAISTHEKKKRSEALKAIKAKAKTLGYSLSELTGDTKTSSKPAKKAPKKAPKIAYQDPENKDNTWGGRGPRPLWLRDAIEAGKTLDEFKV